MAHVIVVGCGNIGSHLIPHLGRLQAVDRVTLIDRDRFEARNMTNQAIEPRDIGKAKSRVLAARLRHIRRDLQVDAIAAPIENVPLGLMRGDLILGCLDSRIARMRLNQSAWRLGVPWIDAGVRADGMLVRVHAYLPGESQPCLECAWSDRDYQSLEVSYPCAGTGGNPAPTNASSGLGALAASLQIIAAQKYLAGQADQVQFGRQVLIDAAHHKHYLTACRRNPRCRFDHEVWRIEKLNADQSRLTLGDALQMAAHGPGQVEHTWLEVEGRPFTKRLLCPGCGHSKHIMRLFASLSEKASGCALCGQKMSAPGWNLAETLSDRLPSRALRRSLRSLGLRNGEVFTVGGPSGERHFEIVQDCRKRAVVRAAASQGSSAAETRLEEILNQSAAESAALLEAYAAYPGYE